MSTKPSAAATRLYEELAALREQLAAERRRADTTTATLAAIERHAETAIATVFRVAGLLLEPDQLADLKLAWFEAMCEPSQRGDAPMPIGGDEGKNLG